MSTYFEGKFKDLRVEYGYEKAITKVVEILLFQSSLPLRFKNGLNKFSDFWSSNFINELSSTQLSTENYVLSLSQYIRSPIIEADILGCLIGIDESSVINAIRISGIIAKIDHPSWHVLQNINSQAKYYLLDEFLQTVAYMQVQYQVRLEEYKQVKKRLNLDQVSAMVFSGLYACQYLMTATENAEDKSLLIPYQVDTNDKVNVEHIWRVFHEVITKANIDKSTITEKKLGILLKSKLMPFLTNDNLTSRLIQEYEGFKELVAYRIEINLYENQVINSYSYELATTYYVEGKQLKLVKRDELTDPFQEKFYTLWMYWLWRGIQAVPESPYFHRMDRGINAEGNFLALAKTQGIMLQLKEVFGIDQAVFDQQYDLSSLILTMLLSQSHYKQDFEQSYRSILTQKNCHPFQALLQLMIEGLMIGQNRMPLTFNKIKDKAIKMSDWVVDESKKSRVRKMTNILRFWSRDLKSDSNSNSFYAEKTFYIIDDFIFVLPWLSAQQNYNTALINNFRKLHKNRASLKFETDRMEKKLAELFSHNNNTVYCQYEPSQSEVGEIDLIVISEETVLVVELKSTYIKSSIKEIYEYKNFVLKKAAYQLNKKTSYIKQVLLPELGYLNRQVSIHSWIVDTTLEFDHENIDGFLKVSFEELLIVLNRHQGFIKEMVSGQENIKKKVSLREIVKDIESDRFWQDSLAVVRATPSFNTNNFTLNSMMQT